MSWIGERSACNTDILHTQQNISVYDGMKWGGLTEKNWL